MYRVAHNDYGIYDPYPQSAPQRRFPGVILAIIIMAFLLGGLFLLYEPVSLAVKTDHIRAQQEAYESQQQAEKEARRRQLQTKLSSVDSKLSKLEHDIQETAARFRSFTGVSLDQADRAMSRQMSHLVLQSDVCAVAWAHILRARIPASSLYENRNILAQVEGELHLMGADAALSTRLDAILSWIDEQQQALQTQRSNLDRIRDASL